VGMAHQIKGARRRMLAVLGRPVGMGRGRQTRGLAPGAGQLDRGLIRQGIARWSVG
jgi:hypothetical protein